MTVLRTAFDFIIDILVFPFENTGDALFLVILFVVAYRIYKSVLNFLKRVLPPPYKLYGYASEEEWRASMPQNGSIQKQTALRKKTRKKKRKTPVSPQTELYVGQDSAEWETKRSDKIHAMRLHADKLDYAFFLPENGYFSLGPNYDIRLYLESRRKKQEQGISMLNEEEDAQVQAGMGYDGKPFGSASSQKAFYQLYQKRKRLNKWEVIYFENTGENCPFPDDLTPAEYESLAAFEVEMDIQGKLRPNDFLFEPDEYRNYPIPLKGRTKQFVQTSTKTATVIPFPTKKSLL